MRFVDLRQVFALDGERPHAVAHLRVEHLARVRDAGRREHRLDDRAAAAAVLDDARPEVGEAVLLRERAHVVVDDHVVVVQVRHRAAAVPVQPERERADHERLEVVHEIAADEIGRVRDLRAQQQARRLPRAARDDDDVARSPRARCRRRRGTARRARVCPLASSSTRSTIDSGRISQRPVRSALRSGAIGSPFASIGQP